MGIFDKFKKIFTKEGSKINVIGKTAFAESNLEYFDFSHCEINTIKQGAFLRCPLNAEDYEGIMTLPVGLIRIETEAFNGGGVGSKMFANSTGMRIIVPSTVTTIEELSICNMDSATGIIVQIGYQNSLSQLDLNNIKVDVEWFGLIHTNKNSQNKGIITLNFYTNKYNTTTVINNNPVWYIMCGGTKEDDIIDLSCLPGNN